jgi:uncharacterized membrane protein
MNSRRFPLHAAARRNPSRLGVYYVQWTTAVSFGQLMLVIDSVLALAAAGLLLAAMARFERSRLILG